MLKNVLNLGKNLSKTDQKSINGGFPNGPLPGGCYCFAVPGDPCSYYPVSCDSLCPTGGLPFERIPFQSINP